MAARGWLMRRSRMVACAAVVVVMSSLPAAARSPSATPYDVSLFTWSRSTDVEGFDQDPVLSELVVGADGRVLLLGGVRRDGVLAPVVWGSDDGRTWTQLEGDLPAGSIAADGVVADDGFLIITALGDDAPAVPLVRSDGTRLASIASPEDVPIAIERSPIGIHLLGVAFAAPTVWTSTDDASTWASAEVAGETAVANELAVTEDGTIVVLGLDHADGQAAPTAWASRDGGVTWHAATLPLGPGSWDVGDLAWTPIGLLARVMDVSTPDGPGVNLVSADGITWQQSVATTGSGSIGTAGPEAIIFGEDAALHSPDGMTWTEEWWPTLAGFDVVASRPMPGGPVVAAGIQTTQPTDGTTPLHATAATFLGAPAPQVAPTAPIDLASPTP